jgi:hypothetical protein
VLDALGPIHAMATSKSGTSHTVLAAAAYQPVGLVKGSSFGNGQACRDFDADYGLASVYWESVSTFHCPGAA